MATTAGGLFFCFSSVTADVAVPAGEEEMVAVATAAGGSSFCFFAAVADAETMIILVSAVAMAVAATAIMAVAAKNNQLKGAL